jgi:hypothetical protein
MRLATRLDEEVLLGGSRGQGGKELHPAVHRVIPLLEATYAEELKRPRRERRGMRAIVRDYLKAAGWPPVAREEQLLQLWKRKRKAAGGKKGGV